MAISMKTENMSEIIGKAEGLEELINRIVNFRDDTGDYIRNTLIDVAVDSKTKIAAFLVKCYQEHVGSEAVDRYEAVEIYVYEKPYHISTSEQIGFGKGIVNPENYFKKITGLSVERDKITVRVAAEGYEEKVYEFGKPETTTLAKFMKAYKIKHPVTEPEIYTNSEAKSRYRGFRNGYENGKKLHRDLRELHGIIESCYDDGFKKGIEARKRDKLTKRS